VDLFACQQGACVFACDCRIWHSQYLVPTSAFVFQFHLDVTIEEVVASKTVAVMSCSAVCVCVDLKMNF
jgi:hypothetical protein